jgi:N-acetylmuramoyl-L-alanine amidase
VGIQAGHWLVDEAPPELENLGTGTAAGGWDEWEVNLLLAQQTAAFLEAAGIQVDLLPATIPIRYRANVFLAIHADGDPAYDARGSKIARSAISSVLAADDLLVADLQAAYRAGTGLPDDPTRVSCDMTYYYAFNPWRYQHALDTGTPAAIIEAGYLTDPDDRAFLTAHADVAASSIAAGLRRFLDRNLGA